MRANISAAGKRASQTRQENASRAGRNWGWPGASQGPAGTVSGNRAEGPVRAGTKCRSWPRRSQARGRPGPVRTGSKPWSKQARAGPQQGCESEIFPGYVSPSNSDTKEAIMLRSLDLGLCYRIEICGPFPGTLKAKTLAYPGKIADRPRRTQLPIDHAEPRIIANKWPNPTRRSGKSAPIQHASGQKQHGPHAAHSGNTRFRRLSAVGKISPATGASGLFPTCRSKPGSHPQMGCALWAQQKQRPGRTMCPTLQNRAARRRSATPPSGMRRFRRRHVCPRPWRG